jgi:hypothetical protein
MTNVMAINDAAPGTAGAILWWRLSGRISYAKLAKAWQEAGHDASLLPAEPTPLAALKGAVRAMTEQRRLVRPLADHDGYAIVDETARRDDLDYGIVARVKVHPEDDTRIGIQPSDFAQADRLRAEYTDARGSIPHGRLGNWLADMAARCKAISLRPTGGIYFVPRTHVARFRAIARTVMDATTCTVYEVPALDSDEAVAAVLDALTAEADAEMADLGDDLNDLGARALRTRERRCDQLRQKLEAYAELLGPALDVINDQLDTTKANVAEAMILAELSDTTSA